jgi:hypothetical protein
MIADSGGGEPVTEPEPAPQPVSKNPKQATKVVVAEMRLVIIVDQISENLASSIPIVHSVEWRADFPC